MDAFAWTCAVVVVVNLIQAIWQAGYDAGRDDSPAPRQWRKNMDTNESLNAEYDA